MVRTSEAHGGHLALLPILVLLCIVSVKSSSTFCQRCSANALLKTKQQVIYLRKSTRQLYKSYFNLMGLPKRICERAVPWFPGGSITSKPINTVLQELHRTLEHMEDSLARIIEQQKSLQHPNSSLHSELQQALLTASGLHVNTHCALCNRGLTPPTITVPAARRMESAFYQKTEGCQMLWNYSKFISTLAKAFQKQLDKQGRSGRTKKRSGQRPSETF